MASSESVTDEEITARKVNLWGAIIFWRSPGSFEATTSQEKFNEKLGNVTVIHLSSAFQFTGMPTLGRGTAKEMLVFIAREVARRTDYGRTRVVSQEGHLCVCSIDETGLCAAVLCAEQYPQAAALNVAGRVMRTFKEECGVLVEQHHRARWNTESKDCKLPCKGILPIIKQMENPATRAKVLAQQVDEIREICVENVSDLLQRGEQIDTMINRADALSTTTRIFYKDTKKLNKCGWASCEIL